MELIQKYFPNLTRQQLLQFEALDALYSAWNAKINVISRKDIEHLYEHHVLHSLCISLLVRFRPGTKVLDFGCGGGFPGIPLAIMFPEVRFRLIDGTGKKVRVAQEVADAVGLKNVEALHRRGEDEHDRYHFVVSRAVMPLPDMVKIVRKNISGEQLNSIVNGIITLKGGDLTEELQPFRNKVEILPISHTIKEEWYENKNVIYLPIKC